MDIDPYLMPYEKNPFQEDCSSKCKRQNNFFLLEENISTVIAKDFKNRNQKVLIIKKLLDRITFPPSPLPPSLLLDLSANYVGMFTLKFIKLYTYDFCTFLYVCYNLILKALILFFVIDKKQIISKYPQGFLNSKKQY